MSFLLRPIQRWYIGKLGDRLSKHGLTYHDAIAETGVYNKAISRLPEHMQEARGRRIKRAMDLSSKHVEIPSAKREDPFREYKAVQDVFSATQFEHDERAALAKRWWMPYHLGRQTWHPYDTKSAWFWQAAKPVRKLL